MTPDTRKRPVIDLVRQHVRRYLRAPFLADEARRRRARAIARAGGKVVRGTMTTATHWEVRDWCTEEMVSRGDDGPAGLQAALLTMYDADDLYAETPGCDTVTPGLPETLSRALEEWVCAPSTPDEEIAALVGWPVSRVREHR